MIPGVVLLLGIWLSPPSPEAVRDAVRAIRSDPAFQQSLPAPSSATGRQGGSRGSSGESPGGVKRRPGDDDEDGGAGGASRRRRRRGIPGADPSDARAQAEPGSLVIPDFVKAVLYVLAGAAVLALVALLARAFLDRGRDRKEVAASKAPVPDPSRPVPAVAFDDADRLAREGRFAEAIHVLLLRTLAALAAQGAGLAVSLTSREVVHEATLTAEARTALAGLVDSVEVSRFGSVVPDAAEYAASRARFERLAAAPFPAAGAA